MPIPLYNSSQQDPNGNPAGSTSLNSGPGSNTNASGRVSGTASAGSVGSSTQGNQPLSKEEADRLYEERMEEEYAKREGGA